MPFTQGQIALLAKLISDVGVQAAASLGVPRKDISNGIATLQNLVNANISRIGAQSFAMVVDVTATGNGVLSFAQIKRHIHAGRPVISIDLNGRFVAANAGKLRVKDAGDRTASSHGFEILIMEGYSYYVLDGKVIDEIDLNEPGAVLALGPRWRYPISEFPQVLRVHMRERLAQERGVTYWKDRANRILRANPEKTEAIFHRDLLWWIRNYTTGVIRTYSEPEGFGQDKTDIVAVTLAGGHVVEVKWLGVNEHKTTYNRKRIDEGLIQVKQYLERDDDLVEGYLVVYDGRSSDEHKKNSHYDQAYQHPLCREPQILYLESEVPTEISARVVRSNKTTKTRKTRKKTR